MNVYFRVLQTERELDQHSEFNDSVHIGDENVLILLLLLLYRAVSHSWHVI